MPVDNVIGFSGKQTYLSNRSYQKEQDKNHIVLYSRNNAKIFRLPDNSIQIPPADMRPRLFLMKWTEQPRTAECQITWWYKSPLTGLLQRQC